MLGKQAPSDRFPDVTGTALNGDGYVLPHDFEAPWNLLVITFRDDLDRLADKWVLVAEQMAGGSEGRIAAYELPIVGKGFKPFKGIVNASIGAKADADADEKARTIPLYVKRKQFQKELGLRDDDTVHVLLVSRDGQIRWRGEGLLTPDKIAGLERAVGETLSDRASDEGPPAPDLVDDNLDESVRGA